MREMSDDAGETDTPTEVGARRIDLSVPQVAGSALAAVVAAELASSFGVYGTILGAGLISVVATCGGSVLQHFFKRTGEQLRVKRTGAARTAPVAASGAVPAKTPGEFTEGTVYRARAKGWKRPLVAAALVFGVTMGGITAYELVSGENLSGGHSTTVGSAFSGHAKSSPDSGKSGESDDSDDGSGDSRNQDSGDSDDSHAPGSGDDTPTATPSGTASGTGGGDTSSGDTSQEDGGTASTPTPTPDATGDDGSGDASSPAPDASATAPEPGASSRSGTDDQGQDGPAAP
ncbi:hypothetical protein ACFFKE_15885 [Streptomyces mutabilis]|uniref:hypothetical protein n=1 Tax=Streptomyces mutabilis TaxID=67332 RepID=UPI0017851CA6|nr:hypothetical protein [Streptomyces mutabilis]GGQ35189.1 hypothetical protein GCM10010279_50020 [Streptomyces mutabilis]